jgi:hypothetical protein
MPVLRKKAKKIAKKPVRKVKPSQKRNAAGREDWIVSMYDFGHRGIWDYGERNNKIVAPTSETVKDGKLKVLPSEYDVVGYDHPRPDIRGYKTKANDLIRVGNDSQSNIHLFGGYGIPLINRSFSEPEISRLEAYYEYPSSRLTGGTMGTTDNWISDSGLKHSIIDVNRKYMKDEPTIVHETIHAMRFRDGLEEKDVDTDEAMVELETIARVSRKGLFQMRNALGYYSYLTNGFEKMKQDRVLLTGSLDKNLTGEEAKRRVREVFHKTNIARLKIGQMNDRRKKKKAARIVSQYKDVMAPEWISRSFEIVLKDGRRVSRSMSFERRAPLADIVSQIKKDFAGELRKISEWRDGKRYLVYQLKPVARKIKKSTIK